MARARLLKPGFFSNEALCELPHATRLLFAGLWTIADREGRLEDRPKRIAGQLFPYESVDAHKMLTELESAGFILRYKASTDARSYIEILAFKAHQHVHVREPESTIPAPDETGARPVPVQNRPGRSRSRSGSVVSPNTDLETNDAGGCKGGTGPAPDWHQAVTVDDVLALLATSPTFTATTRKAVQRISAKAEADDFEAALGSLRDKGEWPWPQNLSREVEAVRKSRQSY